MRTRILLLLLAAAAVLAPGAQAARSSVTRAARSAVSGYSYADLSPGLRAATLCLKSASIGSGHVAVWLGVNDYAGDWLQAGIGDVAGTAGTPSVYVELGRGWRRTSLKTIRTIPMGGCVQVSLERLPDRWRISVDGVGVGGSAIGGQATTLATAESYAEGAPNSYRYRIDPA